jgi:ABC-type multidrug transport system permease subunit
VFYRERASHTYSSFAYSLGLGIVELPYVFASSVVFLLPFYFIVGFQNDGAKYFQFQLVHYLISLSATYLGQLIIAQTANLVHANIMEALIFIAVFMFGGGFIAAPDMPRGWIWAYYLTPLGKGLIAIGTSQYDCTGTSCPTMITYYGVKVFKRDYVSDFVHSNYGVYGDYIGWLALTVVGMRVAVYLAMHYINFLHR